jgi:hypothetical protein
VSKRNVLLRAAAAIAMSASLLAAPTPAQAAGWIGACYPHRGSGGAGGWCDGNGPDWQYRAIVYCTMGGPYYSVMWRWAGDRRGLSAYCRSGSGTAYLGGVEYWYRSEMRGHAFA